MSCFIVSEESCSLIADYVDLQLNFGFNHTQLSTSRELEALFADCRIYHEYKAELIYKKLYRENVLAYRGRYNNSDPIMIPPYRPSCLPGHLSHNDYVRLHKKIACYTYQLAEDATIDGDIYKVFTNIKNRLANKIVLELPESDAIYWG